MTQEEIDRHIELMESDAKFRYNFEQMQKEISMRPIIESNKSITTTYGSELLVKYTTV